MSTLPLTNPFNIPQNVSFNVGDSLTKIANSVLGDPTAWRQLATMNDLNIFNQIPVGQSITIPNQQSAARKFNLTNTIQSSISNQLQSTITEITQSRQAQTVMKLLGVSQASILNDINLSLSGLSKGVAPTSQDQLLSRLKNSTEGTSASQPDWQLVQWVLS